MKKMLLYVLSDSATEELRSMEKEMKIRVLNEEDIRDLPDQKEKIWKELEEYTYENILKKVKESVG